MAETEDVQFTIPKTPQALALTKAALNKLLEENGGSKNELARVTGFSRNSVSFWFSKGYIGRRAAEQLVQSKQYTLKELRPDLFV